MVSQVVSTPVVPIVSPPVVSPPVAATGNAPPPVTNGPSPSFQQTITINNYAGSGSSSPPGSGEIDGFAPFRNLTVFDSGAIREARSILGGGITDVVMGSGKNMVAAGSSLWQSLKSLFRGQPLSSLKNFGAALLNIVRIPLDIFMVLGGKAISAVQTLFHMEPKGRKLTDKEIRFLQPIFGDNINYSAVRLKEGDAGLFGLTDRAFTHGNTIFAQGHVDGPDSKAVLIHEMVHVWQHQHRGPSYMLDSLFSRQFGSGYDWQSSAPKTPWARLETEQQAAFFETAARQGMFDGKGGPFIVNGKDYSEYLHAALRSIQGR